MERGGGIGGEKGKIKVEEGKEEEEEEEEKESSQKKTTKKKRRGDEKKGISSKNKEFKFIQSE